MFELLMRFKDGGSFMWIILMVGCVVVAISAERFWFIYFRAAINGSVVMKQVEKFLSGGDHESAQQYLRGISEKPLARVLSVAIATSKEHPEQINSKVDEVTLEVLPELQKRTPYLFMLANIATLLGLLGTIIGLIQSFGALDLADPTSQARQLGSGISMAMLTTAFGLIVAVPGILMHTILQTKTEQIVEDIDQYSVRIVNLLHSRSGSKAA